MFYFFLLLGYFSPTTRLVVSSYIERFIVSFYGIMVTTNLRTRTPDWSTTYHLYYCSNQIVEIDSKWSELYSPQAFLFRNVTTIHADRRVGLAVDFKAFRICLETNVNK